MCEITSLYSDVLLQQPHTKGAARLPSTCVTSGSRDTSKHTTCLYQRSHLHLVTRSDILHVTHNYRPTEYEITVLIILFRVYICLLLNHKQLVFRYLIVSIQSLEP